MRWADVDLESGIWVTPAEHMEKRKAHRQPLPSRALELLQFIHELTGHASLVLGNQLDKPITENAMLYALKRFDDVTPHRFRAMLGSWCAEQGSFRFLEGASAKVSGRSIPTKRLARRAPERAATLG